MLELATDSASVERQNARQRRHSFLDAVDDGAGHAFVDDPTLTASGEKWFETLIAEGRRVGAVRSDLPGDLLAHLTFSIAEAGDQWLAHHVQDPGSDPRVPEIVASLTDIVESVLRASRTKGGSAT